MNYYYNPMAKFEIDELKDELEGLSLQEKRERLEDVQSEINSEIEELESNLADVSSLLSEVEEEVNISYNKEIRTALETVVAAHDGKYPILLNNTLDVEGLRFRISRYCWDESRLHVDIDSRKHIVRIRDFQKDFDALLKTILPEAYPSEKKFVVILKDGDDVPSVVQHVGELLISVAPQIEEMAKEYHFV